MFFKKLIASFLFLVSSQIAFGQKSFTLEDCESAFRKNNLLLLAQQYNISASQAAVIQAKIWDLPFFSGEFNLINPQEGRVADVGGQGQKAFQIQQLIYLGGKKKNEVAFAKSNVAIAELQLEQLIRNLRYQVRQSFYVLYFEQQKLKSLNSQVAIVDTLAKAFSVQAAKNNIPLKDVVRLQSLSLNITNEILSTKKNINSEQENIKIITGIEGQEVQQGNLEQLYTQKILQSVEALYETSLEKNPEYLSFLKIIESDELRIKWQKSLSTPDLTLGTSYDQKGGAFANQINVTFGIPLKIWDRNRGNIKVAESQLGQTRLEKDFKKWELKNKIESAYLTWKQQQEQYLQVRDVTKGNFEIVYRGVLQNFQKRNISLLDFTDFMESYSQSLLNLNDIQKQIVLSGEVLNYLVNENLF
jgi:outer membrane protein, heavy metal efflux system